MQLVGFVMEKIARPMSPIKCLKDLYFQN